LREAGAASVVHLPTQTLALRNAVTVSCLHPDLTQTTVTMATRKMAMAVQHSARLRSTTIAVVALTNSATDASKSAETELILALILVTMATPSAEMVAVLLASRSSATSALAAH